MGRQKKKGGWNPFRGKHVEDGVEYNAWYNPGARVLNVKSTYKKGLKKALKSAIRPTFKATKKKIWTKELQSVSKNAAIQALQTLKKNLLTEKTKGTIKKAAKKAFHTGVTKTASSLYNNKKVRKKTGQVISVWFANKIGNAIMGKAMGPLGDYIP